MTRWIVGSSLKARRFVVVIAAAIMFFGIMQLRHAKVEVLPEFGPPTVLVHTEALGLSAPEVEQLITVPLEQDLLDGVAWLTAIRSESLPGLSSVEMIFEPGTDLLRARQVVQERISQAAGLPNVSAPPQMIQPESSTSRVMMIGLSSRQLSLIQMSVLARWTIRPRLLGVSGVANVSIWGQRERQLQVQVEPKRLQRLGVTLQQVIKSTGNALWASPLTFLEANTPGTGGFIESANQRLAIQHLQPITNADSLARVPIEDQQGAALRLGDVASVVEDHQPLIGDAVLTEGPGLLLVVERSPGANTIDVTRGVEAALDAMRPGLTGMEIDSTIYRPASFIETSTHNVTTAMLVGLALFILALGAFLFEWRSALISVVAVVLSLIAAGLVLYLRGVTINAMVFAGMMMALGAVIDDAIVDVNNVSGRQRRDHVDGDGGPAASALLGASLEMRSAISYAMLIMLAAVLPLLFMQGESGTFLRPLLFSYALAIVAPMVVALIVTPALSMMLLSKAPLDRREPPVARWPRSLYERALSRAIRTPRLAYITVGAVVVAGLAVVPFLRHSLVPSFKEGTILIHLDAAPGTSLPEMDRITTRVASELRSIPGVQGVGAHVGRAVMSDQVVNVDSGELWVSIDPSADYDGVVRSVQHVVGGYPGIDAHMMTYASGRIATVLTRTNDPIVVRLFGQNLGVLNSKGEEVRNVLAGIDGVVNPRVQLQVEEPTVKVEVDLAAAKRYGIKPGDVRRAAAAMVSGINVGSLFEQQKVFDVVVWGAPEARNSLTDLRNLLLDTPSGGHVRLGEVADVHIRPSPNAIEREGDSRRIDVEANVAGRDLGSVVGEVQRSLQQVKFPLGFHAELLGEYAERRAAQRRLVAKAIAALIGVFLLLRVAVRRASGVARLPGPADRFGGRGAGHVLRGRPSHLARFARRLLDGAGHLYPKRDHDDQPLPASRAA